MGKVLLRLLLIVVAFGCVIAAIGYVLPRNYSTSATITIEAPAADIFPDVNKTERWSLWSPWRPEVISDLSLSYEGPKEGEGAILKWEDPRPDQRFDGQMKILKSDPMREIEFTANMGEIPMDGYFRFEEDDGLTTVTWTAGGTLPSGVAYGWYGIVYNGWLQTELQMSLQRLKERAERKSDKK